MKLQDSKNFDTEKESLASDTTFESVDFMIPLSVPPGDLDNLRIDHYNPGIKISGTSFGENNLQVPGAYHTFQPLFPYTPMSQEKKKTLSPEAKRDIDLILKSWDRSLPSETLTLEIVQESLSSFCKKWKKQPGVVAIGYHELPLEIVVYYDGLVPEVPDNYYYLGKYIPVVFVRKE